MRKEIISEQFNKQVEQFAHLELTRNEKIFKFITDLCEFKKDEMILDVANGSRAFTSYCSNKVRQVVGADISDGLLKYAKENFGKATILHPDFLCCDVENLPFPDNTFDTATCRSAFHHMAKPETVLRKMVRTLKKGGKICIQDMQAYEEKV